MATKKKTTTSEELAQALSSQPVQLDFYSQGHSTEIVPDTAMINVRSNVFGELFFVDPVTHEQISWTNCGEIQQLPLATLRHMKNGAIKFFTNQLIVITGFADENANKFDVEDIYKTLYITQYYKNYFDPADAEEVCSWKPSEIAEKVSMYSQSTKMALVVALNTYIENGMLDSLKAIKAFEEALGCELNKPE